VNNDAVKSAKEWLKMVSPWQAIYKVNKDETSFIYIVRLASLKALARYGGTG